MTNTRCPITKLPHERTPEVVKEIYTVKNAMKMQGRQQISISKMT